MPLKSRSRKYWDHNNGKYPFQVAVPYMSKQDPDPREVFQRLNIDFLRVPFEGQASWGFLTQEGLDAFKKLYGVA